MTSNTLGQGTTARASAHRRALEWVWRGRALAEERLALPNRRQVEELLRRARIACEVAAATADPPGPWRAGDAHHLAAALFAESIGWSLRAFSASQLPATPQEDQRDTATIDDIDEPLSRHWSALVERLGVTRHVAERARALLIQRPFDDATQGRAELASQAQDLGSVARGFIRLLNVTAMPTQRLTRERAWRTSLVCAALVALVVSGLWARAWREEHSDLAVGKPWAQSSVYEPVCQSPLQDCGQSRDHFFHTLEEPSPWLEVDLQRAEQVGVIKVVNRKLCCADRAIPLVVEVSTDHRAWKQVARRDEVFGSWRSSFASTPARWVRFRVDRRSFLHLSEVHVYP